MCAIIGWAGQLPKGSLSAMLLAGQRRGRDATGIAFREDREGGKRRTVSYRLAMPAEVFARQNPHLLKAARLSPIGLAHTRRASPGMPRDDANAHPFHHAKLTYAHNGFISNWKALAKAAGREVGTDSMLLGPMIAARNFSPATGTMALVWIEGESCYAFTSCQDLAAATLTIKRDGKPDEFCTVIASTMEIIQAGAHGAGKGVTVSVDEYEINEGRVYKLTPTCLYDDGPANVNPANYGAVDNFTSRTDPEDPDAGPDEPEGDPMEETP